MWALPASKAWYSAGTVTRIMSAIAPATSTPVGPPPTTTKLSAPRSINDRIVVDVPRTARESGNAAGSRRQASTAGTSSRRALRAEEVRLRTGGEDERIRRPVLPTRRPDGLRGRVDRRDLGEFHVHVLVLGEHAPQRVGDVARCQLRGGDLVEQRLELVVVVAVDQRDADVVVVGQRCAQPRPANPPPTMRTWRLPWCRWSNHLT